MAKKDKLSIIEKVNEVIKILRQVYILIILYGSLAYFVMNPELLEKTIIITLIKNFLGKP